MTALDPSEDAIQCAVIQFCRLYHDGRELAFHVPNEAKRSVAGYRAQAAKGTRKGVSDLFVPVARNGQHGLWLELKAKGKRPTPEQKRFLQDMAAQGYAVGWADNVDGATTIIGNYMRSQDETHAGRGDGVGTGASERARLAVSRDAAAAARSASADNDGTDAGGGGRVSRQADATPAGPETAAPGRLNGSDENDAAPAGKVTGKCRVLVASHASHAAEDERVVAALVALNVPNPLVLLADTERGVAANTLVCSIQVSVETLEAVGWGVTWCDQHGQPVPRAVVDAMHRARSDAATQEQAMANGHGRLN